MFTVSKDSVYYRPFQGYRVNYREGLIKWIDSGNSIRLGSGDTITVSYQVSACKDGGFGYGGINESAVRIDYTPRTWS